MPNLVGTEPNQVPVNGMLGTAAFMNAEQLPVSAPQQAALDAKISRITRSARTADTALAAANIGQLIDIASGTFTQTFVACASLGDGWWCYLRNSGSGDITLDPSGSETIDGLTSYVMYPGELRLVQCDGAALRTVVVTPFQRTFTASASFAKPPGYRFFDALIWAGGVGGGKDASYCPGGGGGACFAWRITAAALAASETVTIGSGGAASTTTTLNSGGSSSFASVTVYSGLPNGDGGSALVSGVKVGIYGNDTLGGLGVSDTFRGFYGGAGGSVVTDRGFTVYGGAGGGGINGATALPTYSSTVFGGAGGASSQSGTAGNGVVPGGGGGSTVTGTAGSGARGELRIFGVA